MGGRSAGSAATVSPAATPRCAHAYIGSGNARGEAVLQAFWFTHPMQTLFTPFQAGDITLANRIVMAPLTRNRALPGRVPGDLQVEYYRQRASAGLIVTE